MIASTAEVKTSKKYDTEKGHHNKERHRAQTVCAADVSYVSNHSTQAIDSSQQGRSASISHSLERARQSISRKFKQQSIKKKISHREKIFGQPKNAELKSKSFSFHLHSTDNSSTNCNQSNDAHSSSLGKSISEENTATFDETDSEDVFLDATDVILPSAECFATNDVHFNNNEINLSSRGDLGVCSHQLGNSASLISSSTETFQSALSEPAISEETYCSSDDDDASSYRSKHDVKVVMTGNNNGDDYPTSNIIAEEKIHDDHSLQTKLSHANSQLSSDNITVRELDTYKSNNRL